MILFNFKSVKKITEKNMNNSFDSFKNATQNENARCFKLKLLAIAFLLVFIFSIIFNTLLLGMFSKHKCLRVSCNKFVIYLTVVNLIGTLCEFPYVIISNFYCRWLFEYVGCVYNVFLGL